MATAVNGTIVRTIGEGDEDGDEMREILDILLSLHESLLEAKKCGKVVRLTISIVKPS